MPPSLADRVRHLLEAIREMTHRLCGSCIAAAVLLCAHACAPAWAESKPALAIKSRAADISVAIDDRLKAYPGLVADCLAEARRWFAEKRAEAEKERQERADILRDPRRWSLERTYDSRSEVARYVSIVRTDDVDAGGAHPNTTIDTILWDRSAKKRVSIRPLFKETADNGPTMTALARLVRIAVAAEKIARDLPSPDDPDKPGSSFSPEQYAERDQFVKDGVAPTLLKLGPVTLAPSITPGKSSGLTFHFSPYAVGAYAEGPYTVFVPWTSFHTYLSPEGAALFGGDRPEIDKDI